MPCGSNPRLALSVDFCLRKPLCWAPIPSLHCLLTFAYESLFSGAPIPSLHCLLTFVYEVSLSGPASQSLYLEVVLDEVSELCMVILEELAGLYELGCFISSDFEHAVVFNDVGYKEIWKSALFYAKKSPGPRISKSRSLSSNPSVV